MISMNWIKKIKIKKTASKSLQLENQKSCASALTHYTDVVTWQVATSKHPHGTRDKSA